MAIRKEDVEMETKFKFDVQLFADTDLPPELRQEAWAKDCWVSGFNGAFFKIFTGNSASYIVDVEEKLEKEDGDTLHIGLAMPLVGTGIIGDNKLRGNEEKMRLRSFDVKVNLIRNGVILKGKMEEKRTSLDLRKKAKELLSRWLSNRIDEMIFEELSTNPTPDRVIFAGNATSENTIGANDFFSAALIGRAKRLATADKTTMVQPIRIDGRDTYVMVIDQWQARDLMADPVWLAAQQHANVRGNANPIISGSLGMYNGVAIHVHPNVLRTNTGASGTKVGHALFLGAQAAVFAVGSNPEWNEEKDDYNNQTGFSFGRIFGIKKAQFKFDEVNWTDFGVVNVLTASEDD